MIRVDIRKQLHTAKGHMSLHVKFSVEEGEMATLFGQSGTGKTTVLRMIAGLTEPDEGYIEAGGDVWFDSQKKINWPVQKRCVGFVFQECTLFPNMTVWENLKFALAQPKDEAMIDELLKRVELSELKHRRPDLLSVGQKQRIALIRSFLRKPRVLLLDEPLSALDVVLRFKLQDELLCIQRRFNVPAIFVSHDLGEVYKLSKRVLWIEEGVIKKVESPDQILGDDSISGKFRFPATIVDILQDQFMYIVVMQIGQHLVKVVASQDEIQDMHVGDAILVAAKAFNPLILRLDS